MYEVDNASAACSRLISSIEPSDVAVAARRDEFIAALNKMAKPYFGDLEEMTYAEWLQRFVDLAYPWTDPLPGRIVFFDLLHRAEARLSDVDHGPVVTSLPHPGGCGATVRRPSRSCCRSTRRPTS